MQLDDTAYRFFRNTPTSVGKTARFGVAAKAKWKHPHERGEDPFFIIGKISHRNTPTSVGKTADVYAR